MLVHKYIIVTSDQMKEAENNGWDGSLMDFAVMTVNKWKDEMLPMARLMNIESSAWTDEMRPVQCNSGTWYKRQSVGLRVWMDSDDPIPQKVKLTEKGRAWFASLVKNDAEKNPFLEREFLWKRSNPDPEGYVRLALEPCSRAVQVPDRYIENFTG